MMGHSPSNCYGYMKERMDDSMTKRMLAILLAALLVLSVFAGCGKDKPEDDTTTTTTTVADQGGEDVGGDEETDPSGEELTDPSGEEETDPSEEETLTTETDAKGNTVTTKRTYNKKTNTKTTTTKKQNNNGTTKKNTTSTKKQDAGSSEQPPADVSGLSMPLKTTVKWSLFLKEHAYQPIKEGSPKFDAIYELTNVDLQIDVGDGASSSTKLMAAAASGKFYDIAYLQLSDFRTYKRSLFYDITDLINKNDLPNYYKAIKPYENDSKLFSTGGRFYGFSQLHYDDYESSVLMPWVRVDVFEDNNIKKPTSWKEWFEAMKLLKKKYPDSVPFTGRTSSATIDYWTQMLGEKYNIYYDVEEGKWKCGVLNASLFKNILQFMKDCYDEGILDPNFDTATDKNFQDLATSTKCFFSIDSGSPFAKANAILQETNKNAQFIGIDPFTSHFVGNKQSTYMFTAGASMQSAYYIGSQAERVSELLFFMDWCYSDEGAITNNFGKQGVHYEMSNGRPYVPKKVWQKYADAPDKMYGWMSDIGLGQICFAPAFGTKDEPWEDFEFYPEDAPTHEWQCAAYDEAKKGYADTYYALSPDVSEEMVARYDTLQNYIRTQVIAFVKGARDMNEYNNFVSDLKMMGVEELLAEANK